MKRIKVLCLEGGGIFGKIITRFLSFLPADYQNLKDISVTGGCSIGGILACAYAAGQPFGLVDEVFSKRASECFTKRFAAKINPCAVPTYRTDTIDKVLSDMIGEATLGDVCNIYPQLKLIVPALDITNDKYIVFTNMTHDYDDVKLKDIAGFTSAAPSYFAGRPFRDTCLIDGGLIDVSNALTMVTAIKKELGIPFCKVDLLLLGAGQDVDSEDEKLTLRRYNDLGLIGIARKLLVPYATFSNKLATKAFCEGLGLHYFNYYNPLVVSGGLDDVDQIPQLEKAADPLREDFLHVWDEWMNA